MIRKCEEPKCPQQIRARCECDWSGEMMTEIEAWEECVREFSGPTDCCGLCGFLRTVMLAQRIESVVYFKMLETIRDAMPFGRSYIASCDAKGHAFRVKFCREQIERLKKEVK